MSTQDMEEALYTWKLKRNNSELLGMNSIIRQIKISMEGPTNRMDQEADRISELDTKWKKSNIPQTKLIIKRFE